MLQLRLSMSMTHTMTYNTMTYIHHLPKPRVDRPTLIAEQTNHIDPTRASTPAPSATVSDYALASCVRDDKPPEAL